MGATGLRVQQEAGPRGGFGSKVVMDCGLSANCGVFPPLEPRPEGCRTALLCSALPSLPRQSPPARGRACLFYPLSLRIIPERGFGGILREHVISPCLYRGGSRGPKRQGVSEVKLDPVS